MSLHVWENEKYKIEITNKRASAVEKETGLVLADIICLGDQENTISTLKKYIVFHELGAPESKLVWENEEFKLEYGFSWDDLYLRNKPNDNIIARFHCDSIEVVDVIKKVIAFL